MPGPARVVPSSVSLKRYYVCVSCIFLFDMNMLAGAVKE